MTTLYDTIARKLGGARRRLPTRGALRRAAAGAFAVWTAVLPGIPAAAQTGRRSAEPEANPQFQQDMQGAPSGGGAPLGAPLSTEPPPDLSAAPPSSPPLSADPLAAPAPVSSVQIGAAPVAQPRAAERVNPLDTRITVRVKGAPLATFLDTISAQSKVNFIMTEGIEAKKVTAFLQNVTVREALQVLLEIGGLTYQQIGKSNTYVVTLRSKAIENLITRIYTLAYIPLIPLATSGLAGGSSGGSGTAAPTNEIGIINVLKSILSKSGQVALEPRTNALIVTDIPEVFPQVEQIIAELDKKAPQVMIEAQIVEINSSRQKELGIEWGGAAGEIVSFTAGQRDTSFPMQLPGNLSRIRFLDPVSNVVSSVGSGAGALAANTVGGGDLGGGTVQPAAAAFFNSGLKTSILDLTALRIALRALVARSEARFLGKPKILTLNNKSAVIQVSQSQAVSIQQSVSSGGTLSQASTSAERVPTGLVLSVTPQVNKEGYITMLVEPSFTDVQASAVSTASNKVFDPISRKASTLVRVKNGQTLVMGGLLSSTETKVVRKVPFLGYIPLIGWLFTSNSTQRRNSDLVLFITPTIVSD